MVIGALAAASAFSPPAPTCSGNGNFYVCIAGQADPTALAGSTQTAGHALSVS